MLEQLAVHHEKWVRMAYSFCKDNDRAQDIVGDMYVKVSDCKEWNDYFIYFTIKHIFIDGLRYEKTRKSTEKNFYDIDVIDTPEKDHLMIETLIDEMQVEIDQKLTWVEKQILIKRQTRSSRDIERQYHINYQKVHRIEKQAKEKLKENLKVWERKLGGLEM